MYEVGQDPTLNELRRLRFAAMSQLNGWHLPANISAPLERAGFIRARHEGWGFYSFDFTAAGRERLADSPGGPRGGWPDACS